MDDARKLTSPRCVACGGKEFGAVDATVIDLKNQMTFICCAKCGVAVGVLPKESAPRKQAKPSRAL